MKHSDPPVYISIEETMVQVFPTGLGSLFNNMYKKDVENTLTFSYSYKWNENISLFRQFKSEICMVLVWK